MKRYLVLIVVVVAIVVVVVVCGSFIPSSENCDLTLLYCPKIVYQLSIPYSQRVWITRNVKVTIDWLRRSGISPQSRDKIKLVQIDLQNKPDWYKEKVYPTNKVDIPHAPFIERFQIFMPEGFNYGITTGRPKLAKWIEEMNKLDGYKLTKVLEHEKMVEYCKNCFLSLRLYFPARALSRPEPIPWAKLALENHCLPQANPWPDLLLSGRLYSTKISSSNT
ncbi:hypothetical protein MTR67_026016 [Solanum verrucosum]|uniref:Uncharacterized protein n=1 Tax=Solanum verrucosum TaxID=315347 RepID=A0AAF0TU25_SOLVR|nr:hypothetical protein MTR67_026016 [Solanum verrucosum]